MAGISNNKKERENERKTNSLNIDGKVGNGRENCKESMLLNRFHFMAIQFHNIYSNFGKLSWKKSCSLAVIWIEISCFHFLYRTKIDIAFATHIELMVFVFISIAMHWI